MGEKRLGMASMRGYEGTTTSLARPVLGFVLSGIHRMFGFAYRSRLWARNRKLLQ